VIEINHSKIEYFSQVRLQLPLAIKTERQTKKYTKSSQLILPPSDKLGSTTYAPLLPYLVIFDYGATSPLLSGKMKRSVVRREPNDLVDLF